MTLDDLRYSLRMLRRSPINTGAILLTVALGIGATTAVYSVVHAVLVRPLPYADPNRLVWVAERNDKLNLPTFPTSGLNLRSWLEDPGPIDSLGAIGFTTYNWAGAGEPEVLNGGTLTAAIFPALGIHALTGRAFTAAEEQIGAAPVAMLSEPLWRRRFDRDPAIVGRQLDLNGGVYTVVGVAPASLNIIAPGDVWTPMVIDPAKERRLSHQIIAIGRLKPGFTLERAQAGMDVVSSRVGTQYPETKDWAIRLVSMPNFVVPAQTRTVLVTLLVAVLAVLLIAAANIANLLLSRALAREREAAIRGALGASRGRILAQLLVESLLLAVGGGLLGVGAAYVTVRWAATALPAGLLPIQDFGLERGVLLFALGLSLLCGLLFGLAPAWQIAGSPVAGVLRAGGRGAVGDRRRLLKRGLATVEITLATALLVVAGLLVETASRLGRVALGFDAAHVLTFQVNLPQAKDPTAAGPHAFLRELCPALAALPGVTAAAVSSGVPMGAGNFTATPIRPLGSTTMKPDDALTVDWRLAGPDYFKVMSIPLLRGRAFTDADDVNAAPTAIVSKSLAERFWGTDDVVGRTIHRVGDNREFAIAGVVGDARLNALGTVAPSIYYSSGSRLWPLMDIVVQTTGDPEAAIPAVRERVHALDPALPLTNVRPMSFWVRANNAQPRLNAGLLAGFAGLALVIAAIGIYGVLAHSVSQRTSEIGLRMALGASRGRVVGLFLREGLTIGAIGIALGLGAALAAGRLLSGLVFGVTAHDGATFTVVALGLGTVTALACFLPARRAAEVDPAVSLRDS
jgi:putative ABC transport system permease protein